MDESLNLLDDLDIDIPESPTGRVGDEGKNFFGPYQLIQEVGAGGVAKVMRARHIHPFYADKTFAIKLLHEELSADPNVLSLFRHEAYVLSLLKHPNIIQTFEAGAQDSVLFIAMEYVDGRDLDNMLLRCTRRNIPVPLHISMHIIGEVLKALTYAHELRGHDDMPLNLVHRDVNPANVFLSYDGRVKLGDFGVADIAAGRVEKSREIAGKLGYFAPEQLAGGRVDHRVDLFALGVMMFEMLCGERLFAAEDANKALRLNRRAKIPKPSKLNPDIPPGLEKAMLGALERKPENRFSSGHAMLAALAPYIPSRKGMALAVASTMRKVFLKEHIQELQLKEGLAGVGPARGSGQAIDVVSTDERARVAFNELLLSRGYRVRLHETCATLGAAEATMQLLVVDVSCAAFDADAFAAVLQRIGQPLPVVAVSERLELNWIALADRLGAVDMLFKPFNIERVLTAVRAALTGGTRISDATEGLQRPHDSDSISKVLLLSQDPELTAVISLGLVTRGFLVDVSPTTAEAMTRSDETSYRAVIYDASPTSSADKLFAGQFRSRPGMGLVPMVFLVADAERGMFGGMLMDRCSVHSRGTDVAGLADEVLRLQGDIKVGRTFVRYNVNFAVELRYGGRVFPGTVCDVSRGGMMLVCAQMPPVGTQVGINTRLPTQRNAVQLVARVIRVDLPTGDAGEGARLGIEYVSFHGRGEANLIAFITELHLRSELGATIAPASSA